MSEDEEHHQGGMGQRGVTRPMAEMKHGQNDDDEGGGNHHMSEEDRWQMLRMHHKQTLWVYWTILLLGCWTLLSPLTFGYGVATVDPSGGRNLWLSLDARISAMIWSDLLSGLGLLFFGWRSLRPDRPISLWLCCGIGVWMSMAPILFWAPTAAAYLNGTFVGALVIALTILIPGMPNMIMYMQMGGDQPGGWSYNPSSWAQRWIMIVTGFLGWVVSRYLAAFQLGYIDQIWDPFFGGGTRLVLNSKMSHALPISDGALGTFAYTFEFLMGYMGAPSRWRTMPWMVAFFGILVIPLGLVHIFLVGSQAVIVGEWCTFCLLAAAIMLPMIPLEVDEVIAMGQHMKRAIGNGESAWRVFWKGGKPGEATRDDRSPEMIELPEKPWAVFKASIWGMSFPWTLVVSTVIGLWVVFGPFLFGTAKPVADVLHVAGELIVVISVICMGEPLRLGRYLNVPTGLALAVVPWFLGAPPLAAVNATICGLLVAALAIPRGVIRESYGDWNRFVR